MNTSCDSFLAKKQVIFQLPELEKIGTGAGAFGGVTETSTLVVGKRKEFS
jgi:hypothetical protein